MDLAVKRFDSIGSTNDHCMKLARQGASEGLVVWADYQTQGKGRMGRHWLSPKGRGLLASLLLRPRAGQMHRVHAFTDLGVNAAIQSIKKVSGLRAQWDRPNDVIYQGKKIAGVLSEVSTKGHLIDWAVVGVGINVLTEENELPEGATSLKVITGQSYDIEKVFRELLSELCSGYEALCRLWAGEAS